MNKKVIKGLIVSLLIVMIPVLGNMAMLSSLKLWIMITVGIVASMFQPDYNPFKKSPNNKDRGTAKQIIWSIYITQVCVLIEAAYFRYPESVYWNNFTYAALVFMAAGLAIRSWGVFTLGKYFTWHITTQKNQTVIKTGPYAFVRHPGYLGAFITYISTAIFLNAWFSLMLSLIILPFAFLRRIHYEEQELKNNLGSEYKIYCKKVKRFIPMIW